MLKSIFIFINLIGVLLFSIINTEDVIISHIGPSEITQGEKTEVKITINKMDFSGPGRLKLDLTEAEGITIAEKENDGASFTFKNNEGLYIWYDLPQNKNIVITYLLSPGNSIDGLKKIKGSFSFIDNNDRKQLEIPSLIIKVIKKEDIAEKPSVKVNRTIEGSYGQYIVKIHTVKGKHQGFARIKDDLPDGFIAESIESAGGIFKNIDGSAKFIWSDLPSTIESFTVSYKLKNPKSEDTPFSIQGVYASEQLINEGHNSGIEIPITYFNPESDLFNYNELSNDTSTKEIEKNEEILISEDNLKNIEEDTIVEIEIIDEISSTVDEDLENKTEVFEDTIEKNEIVMTNTNDEKNISEEVSLFVESDVDKAIIANINKTAVKENIVTTKTTLTNINYKVQILAAHRIANKKYILSQFKFNEKYDLENHEGWIKYTTGSFMDYKGARNKRNSLDEHKFPGPFVTAYNYGERISVQEALIISKQSWIP